MKPPRVLHPSFNCAHWLAYKTFRASLEPEALAESIAQSEFLAWREACATVETVNDSIFIY